MHMPGTHPFFQCETSLRLLLKTQSHPSSYQQQKNGQFVSRVYKVVEISMVMSYTKQNYIENISYIATTLIIEVVCIQICCRLI